MRKRRLVVAGYVAALLTTVAFTATYAVAGIDRGDTTVRYCERVPDRDLWACSEAPVSFYWNRPI